MFNRMIGILDSYQDEEQVGSQAGCSTIDQVFILHQLRKNLPSITKRYRFYKGFYLSIEEMTLVYPK